jgi:hypothetical protein
MSKVIGPTTPRMLVLKIVAAAAGVIVLVTVLLVIANAVAPTSKRAEFRLEVSKAFVQFAVITILGSLVAAAVKYVESLRERNRRVNEYWAGLFREIVTAYNGIKAVRRSLRALGFRSPETHSLSIEQVAQFQAQMASLLQSQLSLERVERELRTSPEYGAEDARRAILIVEDYIHNVIKDWEDHGFEITAGKQPNRLTPMRNMQLFLAPAEQGFHESATEPMALLEDFIGRKLGRAGSLGVRTAQPLRAPGAHDVQEPSSPS